MRIWLASVASQGCRIGKIVAGAVAVIALTTCAFGQSSSSRRRGKPETSRPVTGQLSWNGRPPVATDRDSLLCFRPRIWVGDLHAAEEFASASRDARNF